MQFLYRISKVIPDLLHTRGTTITIINPPYQAVTVEYIGSGPFGRPALSIAQLCGQGAKPDHVRQMCFEMELEKGTLHALHPYFYRDGDWNTIKTPVAEYRTGYPTVIDQRELAAELKVAASWSRRLITQGFLNTSLLSRWTATRLAL